MVLNQDSSVDVVWFSKIMFPLFDEKKMARGIVIVGNNALIKLSMVFYVKFCM